MREHVVVHDILMPPPFVPQFSVSFVPPCAASLCPPLLLTSTHCTALHIHFVVQLRSSICHFAQIAGQFLRTDVKSGVTHLFIITREQR